MQTSRFAQIFAFASAAALACAQALPQIEMNKTYQCPQNLTFQVLSCAGADANAACQVQSYTSGKANNKETQPRQVLQAMIAVCAQAVAGGAQGGGRGAAPAAAQVSPAGFRVGDTVLANTGFGWIESKVLAFQGDNYRVNANGVEVTKTYPTEVHRNGAPNDYDHAHGIFELHDRVQVLINGTGWVNGEITGTQGNDYHVALPGNKEAWANPQQLKFVSVAPPKAVTKAGVAPKPGFVSCAGKLDGRYAMANGGPGMKVVFSGGKATVSDPLSDEERECWIKGDQIILKLVGTEFQNQDMDLDLNKDGTIDTPFGQLKKRN